jgi:hypothetical protein
MTKGSERRSINQERKGMPEMALKGGGVHQQGAETPLVKALGDAMHGVRLCTFKPFVYDDHRARARAWGCETDPLARPVDQMSWSLA